MKELLKKNIEKSSNRVELWTSLLNDIGTKTVAEVGVYRGKFAAQILEGSGGIEKYYMIDPWRNLDNWNKPANKDDETFSRFYEETLKKTGFAGDKRVILRGTTAEVIDEIPDESLDFVYIDGDHTLRGITVDLYRVYPKVKEGGIIVGDDFCPSIWEHPPEFEPTLIFPYAVYFAEAVSNVLYAVPYNQFLMVKKSGGDFRFVDLTGKYGETGLRKQVIGSMKMQMRSVYLLLKKIKRSLTK